MDALTSTRPARSALLNLAGALRAAAAAVSAAAKRLDAWLAERERARRDRDQLAEMTDRELSDIGLSRGYRGHAASGAWTRELLR